MMVISQNPTYQFMRDAQDKDLIDEIFPINAKTKLRDVVNKTQKAFSHTVAMGWKQSMERDKNDEV